MESQKEGPAAGLSRIIWVLLFALTFVSSVPATTQAAEPVTVFLLDSKYEPVVRLEKLSPPLTEGLRAILAMYALQDGGGCEGETDPNEKGLHCALTTALGVGPQCSEAQLRLVRAWFKSLPKMSGLAADHYLNIQRPDSLETICYAAPYTASFQQIWDRIRVTQDGGEVVVDAVGSWLARDESGHFHYRSKYKIEDHSITTLSHEEVPWKGQSKQE